MRYLLIISCLFLSGCAGAVTTLHRDSQGKVWQIETKGQAETKFKQGDEEFYQDTKTTPIINIKTPDFVAGKIGA